MSLRQQVMVTSFVVMMLPYEMGHLAFILMFSAILNAAIESRIDRTFLVE